MRDEILERVRDSYQTKLQEMCYGTGEEVIDIVYRQIRLSTNENSGKDDIKNYLNSIAGEMEKTIEDLKSRLPDYEARAVHKFSYSADVFRTLATLIENL